MTDYASFMTKFKSIRHTSHVTPQMLQKHTTISNE